MNEYKRALNDACDALYSAEEEHAVKKNQKLHGIVDISTNARKRVNLEY